MWHWLEAALTIALTLGKYCYKYFLYISSFNTTMLQGNIIIPILLVRIIQWSWGHTTRQLQHKHSNPGHMILEFIFSTMILCGFWKETVREGDAIVIIHFSSGYVVLIRHMTCWLSWVFQNIFPSSFRIWNPQGQRRCILFSLCL